MALAPTEFGKRMESARRKRNWSRADLAEMAGFRRVAGVHELENGTVKEPRHSRAVAIAAALGVAVEWLYGTGPRQVPDLRDPIRARRKRKPVVAVVGPTPAPASTEAA